LGNKKRKPVFNNKNTAENNHKLLIDNEKSKNIFIKFIFRQNFYKDNLNYSNFVFLFFVYDEQKNYSS